MKSSMPKQEMPHDQGRPALKKVILSVFVLLLIIPCYSQVLFTYGKHSVSQDEFLKAYNKNNSDTAGNALNMDDYLNLYIRFKLKVQAARDAGLDTSAEQINELQSFRYQLSENYIREDVSINLLVDEAAQRSQKDIHLSQIFVPLMHEAPDDTVSDAQAKINAAWERLKKGEPFEKVGRNFNFASVGYITAFVLPYDIESIAYSLKPGQFSAPFRTGAGFFILRNDGERKAVGKLRTAQILLAYPPDNAETAKPVLAKRADSIYQAVKAGADFAELARTYSDDPHTFYVGGEMPAFGTGQYDTVFENHAFGLQNDGDISQPFTTNFGYHIVKRVQRIPVPENTDDKDWREVVRDRVLQSDRMEIAHDKLIESLRGVIARDANTEELSSDSAVLRYYRNHLEQYNSEFADQMREFREGNLLFAIMQRKVWDAAAEDSAGLQNYFAQHRDKYYWENSADALIITCLVPDSVSSVQAALKNNHAAWRDVVEANNSLVLIDSARFDLSQIPVVDRTNFTEGLFTATVVNQPDSSHTFAYIIKMYPGKSQKSFADARGSVINDYQTYLEEQWVAELKKKYPVKVNRKTLAKLKS